jgi:hypothetical protein
MSQRQYVLVPRAIQTWYYTSLISDTRTTDIRLTAADLKETISKSRHKRRENGREEKPPYLLQFACLYFPRHWYRGVRVVVVCFTPCTVVLWQWILQSRAVQTFHSMKLFHVASCAREDIHQAACHSRKYPHSIKKLIEKRQGGRVMGICLLRKSPAHSWRILFAV